MYNKCGEAGVIRNAIYIFVKRKIKKNWNKIQRIFIKIDHCAMAHKHGLLHACLSAESLIAKWNAKKRCSQQKFIFNTQQSCILCFVECQNRKKRNNCTILQCLACVIVHAVKKYRCTFGNKSLGGWINRNADEHFYEMHHNYTFCG